MTAAPVDRRERRLVWAAAVLGVLVTAGYVLAFAGNEPLAGDQVDYDTIGRLARQGHWLWSDIPYGIPHPSAWKPPVYPLWMGVWYTLLGDEPRNVELLQALLVAPTVLLTWTLARRFSDDRRVRVAAAFAVALYPMAWQYAGLLYPEALAIPLSLALLAAGLGGGPTRRRAVGVGVLLGLNLLLRPTAFFLFAGVLAGWLAVAGLRRAGEAGLVALVVAAVIVAPWLARNAHVVGEPILSVQDAAIAGTFNPTSAGDAENRFGWRPLVPRDFDLFVRAQPLGEVDLRAELIDRGAAYMRAHPASVAKAFFYNGLVRTWDARKPGYALAEVPFEGRVEGVAIAALAAYYVLALLALGGLWLVRRDRQLIVTLAVVALAASAVFTVAAGTRYRAPLEPVIALLACLAAIGGFEAIRSRRAA